MVLMLAAEDASALIASYREKTRAEVRCSAATDRDEIVICGARDADRYRVPFVANPGDPRHEGVHEERERLLARTNPCQDMSLYQVNCGMSGVSAGFKFGASGINDAHIFRPLAR